MKTPHLSTNFTEAEFIATQQRDLLDQQERYWRESTAVRLNAIRFARGGLEQVREVVGPCAITSGYRCPPLNERVGGAQASRHLVGLAADILPLKVGVVEAMEMLVAALREGRLPGVDRIIYEHGRWLHIQAPLESQKPAGLALMTFGSGYPDFDVTDPRVVSRRLIVS